MHSLRPWSTPAALLVLCPLVIGCSGAGNSGGGGTQPSGPAVQLSASSLSFTAADSGYPTAAQTITLTNSGSTSLTLGNETLSGADASYFGGVGGGVGGCSQISLAPAASCTTQVVFTPVAARNYTATLTFSDNAGNSPQTVALTGALSAAPAPGAQAKFAYVGSSQGGIYGFTISSSGTWTALPAVSLNGDSFGAMVMDPLGKFLFVSGFTSGEISAFSMNQSTGALTLADTATPTNFNNRPENMAINPAGTFLYISNTGIGTVDEYTVNRTTGAVTYGSSVTVPLAPRVQPGETTPSGLTTDATGKFLYVSEAGYMAAYSINSQTGALTSLTTPNLQGIACFNLHLDPTGKYLYCAPGSSGISIYNIDASTGALSYGTQLGYPIPTGQGATDIGITFNSTYAYVTNRTDGSYSLYTDNPSTGYLTAMNPGTLSRGGGEPYQFVIDPGDQLAYVVLEIGGINILSINTDGTLSLITNVSISSPVALAIYPAHP
jgi:6-phosphogluconolactonase (cycloisomerase 2 family)